MPVRERRKELFSDLVRLKRLGMLLPGNEDVAAVRSRVESELGDTVSRRLAAEVLGMSHTALERWIAGGELPVVLALNGRPEVPVTELLELHDRVERERRAGRRQRLLEPSMKAARQRAAMLDPIALVSDGVRRDVDGHSRSDLRALAYHRALAPQLRRPIVSEARRQVLHWRDQGRIDRHYAEQWEDVLGRSIPEIRAAISEDSQRGRDLRQNSPFVGMLSEPERRRILQEL